MPTPHSANLIFPPPPPRPPIGCRLASTLLAALLSTGCAGYQLGTQSLFPPGIRTVYVPVFGADSYRRNLGERLTEAVIKQIELTTPYKVVHTPDADSVLTGHIQLERKRVVAENANDIPRDIENDMVVEINWYDRRGQMMLQSATIPLTPLGLAVAQTTNFIPEAGQSIATAQQEAIERLARQIVGQMEAPW